MTVPGACGVQAVLFDFDGTLVDSARDLAAAANTMRAARGLAPLDYERLRCHAGSGARGMLGEAFDCRPGDTGYESLRVEFLDLYERAMLDTAVVFHGVAELLDDLVSRGLRWGIVTNKALRFAGPMVTALRLAPSVLVGGDSTPHTKPHPAPLLHAADCLGVAPGRCVYVGDDRRDMLAAQAAGMEGWAAAWGYLGPGVGLDDLAGWPAARVIATPKDLRLALDPA